MERLFFRNKNMAEVLDFIIEFLVLEDVPSSVYEDFLKGDDEYQEKLVREIYLKYANRAYYENIPVPANDMSKVGFDDRYDTSYFP